MKKRICILSYSFIQQDARVRRQIEYLLPYYDLTVIGFGDPDPAWKDITWHQVDLVLNSVEKLTRNAAQTVGRVIPPFYDLYHRARPLYRQTLRYLLDSHADAIHANDLSALPVGAEAARRLGAKLVFDAHEYSPLEQETPKFKRLETPYRTDLLHRYARRADASITVCAPIARRYAEEFGFDPIVIMNAPQPQSAPDHPVDPSRIRLIHHGTFQSDRRIDQMIRALALTDSRYELHFMLIISSDELANLQRLADEVAPGRVTFHQSVKTTEVVGTLAQYDAGFYMLAPSNYNNLIALPNKFFDFIMAGLAVIIGPSPSMAELAQTHGFGRIASAFEPESVAALLNALTADEITAMRQAAREASKVLNAQVEMEKLVNLYRQVLPP